MGKRKFIKTASGCESVVARWRISIVLFAVDADGFGRTARDGFHHLLQFVGCFWLVEDVGPSVVNGKFVFDLVSTKNSRRDFIAKPTVDALPIHIKLPRDILNNSVFEVGHGLVDVIGGSFLL